MPNSLPYPISKSFSNLCIRKPKLFVTPIFTYFTNILHDTFNTPQYYKNSVYQNFTKLFMAQFYKKIRIIHSKRRYIFQLSEK